MAGFVFDPAYTEECQRVRPDWTPGDGQASSLAELAILLTTLPGLALLVLLGLLLWTRNIVLAALLAVYCVFLTVSWTTEYNLNDDLFLGTVGGCVGSLDAPLAFLAAVSILGIIILVNELRNWWRSGST